VTCFNFIVIVLLNGVTYLDIGIIGPALENFMFRSTPFLAVFWGFSFGIATWLKKIIGTLF